MTSDAGEHITVDTLRNLLRVQTGLRDDAEGRWRRAHRVLVSLMETFAPDEVQRRLERGEMLDSATVEELEALLRTILGAQLARARSLPRGVGESADDAARLRSELTAARTDAQRLGDLLRQIEAERASLRSQLAAAEQVAAAGARQSAAPAVPASVPVLLPAEASTALVPEEPEWMRQWRRAETFDRDAAVVRLVGSTGLSRRPVIEGHVAEMLGVKKNSNSIRALVARLCEPYQLLEIDRPWDGEGSGAGGRNPDLLRLTERGRQAYWLLTGAQAAEWEFDGLLKRHVTPEHAVLNLQAADLLSGAGYRVNLTPPVIQLPGGRTFHPDLVLHDEQGALVYVEVEREANKNVEARRSKWLNFHEAAGGRLHVVCDNRTCMKAIQSEINFALGSRPVTAYLTNVADLQKDMRGEADSVWLHVRRREAGA